MTTRLLTLAALAAAHIAHGALHPAEKLMARADADVCRGGNAMGGEEDG